MKQVLFVTDGIFHPPLPGRLVLHAVLRGMPGFAFQHIRSLESLPAGLENFSALVLNFHHKTISSVALEKLEQYVKNGGGILAIHAAAASFKQSLRYAEIIGGKFVGHGKVQQFELFNQNSEAFSSIPSFSVKDELYIFDLTDKIQVHFSVNHAEKHIPAVWTNQYGRGRVCYAVPGHTTGSMKNPAYQALLRRGLEWVCDE